MSRYFKSAIKTFSGVEPLLTFPTGLYAEPTDVDMYGCFDYIWVRGNFEVESARVVWDCGSDELFASDHFPITADLIFYN